MRTAIDNFDRLYSDLSERSIDLLNRTGDERLYGNETGEFRHTIGEQVLLSAGAVEQMINGITRRLWDDPFEWTLPERMPSVADVVGYVNEVENTRRKGFLYLKDDADLDRSLPAPVEIKTLKQVLSDTLKRAENAFAKAEKLLESLDSRQ